MDKVSKIHCVNILNCDLFKIFRIINLNFDMANIFKTQTQNSFYTFFKKNRDLKELQENYNF